MARSRRSASKTASAASAASEASEDSESTDGLENTKQGERKKMAGLTPEQIQALLGATRQKGVYIRYLNDFLTSEESGVCVNDEWVDLRDKKATTLKQGFENAKNAKDAPAGAETVKVIANEDKVYLINLTAAGIEAPELAGAAA